MKRYAWFILAVVFVICVLTTVRVRPAAATQTQESKSAFDGCAATLKEFIENHPNPSLTDRIEGYYLVAGCQEETRQEREAMVSYAKAVTLGKELAESSTATKAKLRLEQIYRSTHNNLLVGIEKIYKIAKESLAQPEK